MKAKTIPYLLGMSVTLFTGHAFAQGHGTSGGAQVVRTTNGLELRDITSLACKTRSGEELLQEMSELRERIDTLKKVYWYFGFSLEREIRQMNFCFTQADFNRAKLPEVNDRDGLLVIPATQAIDFIGIRLFQSKEAYIRASLFQQLSRKSQAMTILHETLHSFIPLEVVSRDQRLRNFVNDLSQLNANQAFATSSLEASMRMNRIDFPLTSRIRKANAFLEFVFGTFDEQREALLSGKITVLQIVAALSPSVLQTLSTQDSIYLKGIQGKEAETFLARYCEDQDEEVLSALRAQANERFDIDLFCITLPSMQDTSNPRPNSSVLMSAGKNMKAFYQSVTDHKFEIHHDRVRVSGGLALLSEFAPQASIEALRLIPIRSLASNVILSPTTRTYTNLLVSIAPGISIAEWSKIVSQNGLLKQALNPSKTIAQIEALTVPMSDERRALLDLIPRLFEAFKSTVAIQLKLQGLDQHAQAWIEMNQ